MLVNNTNLLSEVNELLTSIQSMHLGYNKVLPDVSDKAKKEALRIWENKRRNLAESLGHEIDAFNLKNQGDHSKIQKRAQFFFGLPSHVDFEISKVSKSDILKYHQSYPLGNVKEVYAEPIEESKAFVIKQESTEDFSNLYEKIYRSLWPAYEFIYSYSVFFYFGCALTLVSGPGGNELHVIIPLIIGFMFLPGTVPRLKK